MVSSTCGDQVLPTKISWWVSQQYDLLAPQDHIFPQLEDPNSDVIAFIRPIRPTSYTGLGDVHAELHFLHSAGTGVVVRPADISSQHR